MGMRCRQILLGIFTITGLMFASGCVPMVLANEPSVTELKELDPRVLALKYYLVYYNSPLQNHAEEFIAVSDKYNMDWKLLPAIAGVESLFGRRIPGGRNNPASSFNAWGWGVYGGKVIRFTSWDQGIEKVAKGVKENYLNKGLIDSFKMNSKYSSNPDWGWQVAFFMNQIDEYNNAFYAKFGEQIELHNKLVKGGDSPPDLLPLPDTKMVVNQHSLSTVDQSTLISY